MNLILLILLLIEPNTSSRILCIVPTPFYSHQSVFQPIWRELSLRGHQVTVITTNPINNTSLTNLTEIDLSFTYKLVYEDHQMQHVINTESNVLILMKHVFFIMNNMTMEQLQHPEIQKFIEDDKQFDLMIVETHVPAWFGFASKFKCPIIAVTSMEPPGFFKRIMGNLNNPVHSPHFNLPFGNDLNLFQRVVCAIFEIMDEFQTSYLLFPIQQSIIRDALNDQEINLFGILKNVSLLFASAIPGFNKVNINLPSIIQLSGLQIKPPQALPEELHQFLEEATEGVIYFSLGSNVKSFLISIEKQSILLKVFSELPFKVIWKFEDKVINSLPQNVKVVRWAPQQDILRHKNTKLFMTQGGLQSIQEAITFEVPVLGFPFFGDQFHNLYRVRHLKLGSWLDFNTLTEESLKTSILETINNVTYMENLKEISDLLKPPMSSLDQAVWWVEYVLRHKDVKHLRSPLADIPFYQYYLFDVILFLTSVLIVGTLISIQLAKSARKWWCRPTYKKLKKE